jgi:hypothetical protein
VKFPYLLGTRDNRRDNAPEYASRYLYAASKPRLWTPKRNQFCVYVADRLVSPTQYMALKNCPMTV